MVGRGSVVRFESENLGWRWPETDDYRERHSIGGANYLVVSSSRKRFPQDTATLWISDVSFVSLIPISSEAADHISRGVRFRTREGISDRTVATVDSGWPNSGKARGVSRPEERQFPQQEAGESFPSEIRLATRLDSGLLNFRGQEV